MPAMKAGRHAFMSTDTNANGPIRLQSLGTSIVNCTLACARVHMKDWLNCFRTALQRDCDTQMRMSAFDTPEDNVITLPLSSVLSSVCQKRAIKLLNLNSCLELYSLRVGHF